MGRRGDYLIRMIVLIRDRPMLRVKDISKELDSWPSNVTVVLNRYPSVFKRQRQGKEVRVSLRSIEKWR